MPAAVELSWYEPVYLVSVHPGDMHVEAMFRDEARFTMFAAICGLLVMWGSVVI